MAMFLKNDVPLIIQSISIKVYKHCYLYRNTHLGYLYEQDDVFAFSFGIDRRRDCRNQASHLVK